VDRYYALMVLDGTISLRPFQQLETRRPICQNKRKLLRQMDTGLKRASALCDSYGSSFTLTL